MKREIFTIAAVVTASAAVLFANVLSTVAAQGTTSFQWYEGAPVAGTDGQYQSLNNLASSGKIKYTSYTIKGKGRLQWGEVDSDGKYQVYYDSNDIRVLAEEVNRQTKAYNDAYEKYRKLVDSLK